MFLSFFLQNLANMLTCLPQRSLIQRFYSPLSPTVCSLTGDMSVLIRLGAYLSELKVLTQFPSRFDINVVVAASDSDNDAQRFKLFQVFFHQSDSVIHQSSYSFIQHLDTDVVAEH